MNEDKHIIYMFTEAKPITHRFRMPVRNSHRANLQAKREGFMKVDRSTTSRIECKRWKYERGFRPWSIDILKKHLVIFEDFWPNTLNPWRYPSKISTLIPRLLLRFSARCRNSGPVNVRKAYRSVELRPIDTWSYPWEDLSLDGDLGPTRQGASTILNADREGCSCILVPRRRFCWEEIGQVKAFLAYSVVVHIAGWIFACMKVLILHFVSKGEEDYSGLLIRIQSHPPQTLNIPRCMLQQMNAAFDRSAFNTWQACRRA